MPTVLGRGGLTIMLASAYPAPAFSIQLLWVLDSSAIERDNESAGDDRMPQQEVFFEQATGNRRIQVLKTYDPNYAREVFEEMDDDAQALLWNSLDIARTYDPTDLPSPTDPCRADFLWDELMDSAREDVRLNPNLRSFFVVSEIQNAAPQSLYVSADWPSAETFAKSLLEKAG